MKKTILTFSIALISICGFAQTKKFYVVDAKIVESSIYRYERIITADSVVVDSAKFTINCWFGQENNPYIQSVPPYNFCAFAQISRTVTGADMSKWINKAKRLAEVYRKQIYPNIP